MLEVLLFTIPLGLTLDIIGFLLIIRYGHSLFIDGHSLFIRSGSGPPDDSMGDQIKDKCAIGDSGPTWESLQW